MMKCPNCNHEIEIEAAFCPACGTRLADSEQMAAPQTKDQTPARPPKRSTFLVIFSFVLSLLSAWTTFVFFLLGQSGFFGKFPQEYAGIFSSAATFFCIVTAVLALFSLFGKNIRRGLGIFALILSLACLVALRLPLNGLFASAAETEKKAAVVTAVPSSSAAASEKAAVAVAPASSAPASAKTEEAAEKPSETEPTGAWSQTIVSEDVYLTIEQASNTAYHLTIDNRSDRDVNFGWVRDSVYVLIITDQGKYRSEINESQFNPVKAYTQRTILFSLPADAGTPISFQVENLYHLDPRGLPSKGVMEDLVFLTGAK